MLPSYNRIDITPDENVYNAYFLYFPKGHIHPALPMVMRRDFYPTGDISGKSLHADFFALYAVRSGRAVHWIDDQPYALVRGDVYLMAPGAMHTFKQFTELELDVFFFKPTLFNAEELAALRECPGLWRLFADDIETGHRIHLRPEEWRGIEAQIELMRNEWADHTRAGCLRLKNAFFHFLVDLARTLEKSTPVRANTEETHSDSVLAEALRFCEEHFDQPLSVSKLAARAFLSPGHFSELFSRETGMPPAAYLRRIRLEKARAMLRETKKPVSEIAIKCGFKDSSQFSRAFRNFFGSRPLQYRKNKNEN